MWFIGVTTNICKRLFAFRNPTLASQLIFFACFQAIRCSQSWWFLYVFQRHSESKLMIFFEELHDTLFIITIDDFNMFSTLEPLHDTSFTITIDDLSIYIFQPLTLPEFAIDDFNMFSTLEPLHDSSFTITINDLSMFFSPWHLLHSHNSRS